MVEVLQRKRGLLTNDDVETCKGGMNTWGYVGDLNDHPQLSCVYQSDDAQNEFLSNPKVCGFLQTQSSLAGTGFFLSYCCVGATALVAVVEDPAMEGPRCRTYRIAVCCMMSVWARKPTFTFPILQTFIKDLSRRPTYTRKPLAHRCSPLPLLLRCSQYGLGEDVYDDDRAAAAKKSAGSEPANGPRVMSGTVQTVVTDRSKM